MLNILALFLFSLPSFAFTLNTNIDAGFGGVSTKVWVTSNSDCLNAGVTKESLLEMANEARDKFWNRVPTSYFRIENGGILETTDSKFLTGKLCANDSVTTCDVATSIPAVNDIVIACNSNTTDNFKSSNYYALSIPNHFSGKEIKGSIIIINDSTNSNFSTLSRTEMINIIAHEMGHAIGLGHTSDEAALMYYTKFSRRDRLGQDDIDGMTYLYPNKLHGLGCNGILGTMKLKKDDHDDFPKYFQLIILSFLITFLLLNLSKARLALRTFFFVCIKPRLFFARK